MNTTKFFCGKAPRGLDVVIDFDFTKHIKMPVEICWRKGLFREKSLLCSVILM